MFNFLRSGPACPFCGGRGKFEFNGRDWNQNAVPESFDYFKCQECSLIYMGRIPEHLERFYRLEQYGIPSSGKDFGPRAASQSYKVKILEPYVKSGDLLEVGPATGEFACVARDAGFAPTLIEMDPNCCRFLRDELKLDVIESGDPKSAIPKDRLFDVICMWQVVEHVPEFWKFIEIAASRLRPGGVFAMSTPNPDSFQAKLLGRSWPHADVPRHLYLISPQWFERECHRWGLQPTLVTTLDEGDVGLNYYGWFLWIRNRFGRFISRERIDRWSAAVTNYFKRIESVEGRGCSYTIVLTKRSA